MQDQGLRTRRIGRPNKQGVPIAIGTGPISKYLSSTTRIVHVRKALTLIVTDPLDPTCYIKVGRGRSRSLSIPRIHANPSTLAYSEIHPIVNASTLNNQAQTSRTYGFYLSRAPNLGKHRLPLVCFPMSSTNLQDSTNPKPLMVGIAEEPPRQWVRIKIALGRTWHVYVNACILGTLEGEERLWVFRTHAIMTMEIIIEIKGNATLWSIGLNLCVMLYRESRIMFKP